MAVFFLYKDNISTGNEEWIQNAMNVFTMRAFWSFPQYVGVTNLTYSEIKHHTIQGLHELGFIPLQLWLLKTHSTDQVINQYVTIFMS